MPASATPLGGVTQLFVNGEMATPARWPNAWWSDRSVFNFSNWGSFNGSVPWAPLNYTPGSPMRFVDSGGSAGLGASGVSAEGAVFVRSHAVCRYVWCLELF